MRIELGHLPDPDLSPNKRLHWRPRAKATKVAKEESIGRVDEQGRPTKPYERAHITITWIAKDKRRRDIDNLFASMKPYIDGLVAARLIEDDSHQNLEYEPIYIIGDKNNTIIEVKEIKEHSNGAT